MTNALRRILLAAATLRLRELELERDRLRRRIADLERRELELVYRSSALELELIRERDRASRFGEPRGRSPSCSDGG